MALAPAFTHLGSVATVPIPGYPPCRWGRSSGKVLAYIVGIPLLKLSPPSFPGRVARAGRSGTAYSLVAPDEVPYLLDLYLFLGRSITLAQPQQESSGEGWLDRARVSVEFLSTQGCSGLALGGDCWL